MNPSPALLLFFLLVVSSSSAPVLDTDGNPLRSGEGETYYVNPAITDVAGPLTLASRRATDCPLRVAQARIRTSDTGLPVRFTPVDGGNGTIELEEDVTVVFDAITLCLQSLLWEIEIGADDRRYYVSTGGQETNPTESNLFSIRRSQISGSVYELFFRGVGRVPSGPLGIFVEEGRRWLGIRNDRPFPFVFQKVNA
ncbi:miraculin-like [Zingiber officinale]|uniref:miraculin-like n=1 Tax=Zingiber officinale TaxID=94328 RepID=UPI001C4A9C75|nr:miraculin-like [Zingiber officinale]